ncbi:MAG: hypothetical protein AB7U20_25405 [Planctomycetaceae bacterium]
MPEFRSCSMLLACVLFGPATFAGDENVLGEVTFSVEVDLGRDIGQSFGSLFEARNAAGRVVAGAGFQDVYNTRFRNGRHTVQFFIRPDKRTADDALTIERLPHPDLDCGVYLFDLNEQIYAWTSVGGDSVRRWDEASHRWVSELPPHAPGIRSGDGVMRLGKGQFTFARDTAKYDGRVILSPPADGGYHDFYYAQGHLFFYHRKTGDGGFTHLYACPWTPDDQGPVDLSRAVVFDTPYDRETPFAWGQWQDQVLTVSNMGGIYVFENGQWRTVLAPDDKTSYQVYSILHWHDRLLLAQYPTGNVFEYQGAEPRRIENWPPRLPGVSPSARECQTLSIYCGDLLAGVWPWAELWRLDGNTSLWHSLGRMFTHPPLTDEFVHPYEPEATQLGLVLNHWGQRVTSMIPHGDALILSTSAKGTVEWPDEYGFLSEEQRREYGAVLRLKMPGNLAAQIAWQDRPIRLDFTLRGRELSISQDGTTLAATTLPAEFTVDATQFAVNWGAGTFGPLRGSLIRREYRTASETP